MKSDKWILLLLSFLVLTLAATLALSACGDDDDDDNDDNDAADDDDNDTGDDDDDTGDDDDDDACDCEIAGDCYASGDTNPDNVCLICNPSQSSVSWSSNDYATCDDELYCNGADSCLSGECTEHAGDPCENPWELCDDEADECPADCTIVWTHYYDDCGYGIALVPGHPITLSQVITGCESGDADFSPESYRFICIIENWDDCWAANQCVDANN